MKTIHSTYKTSIWGLYPIKKDYPILIVILLLATFLRFNHLNEPGLWLDEVSYTIAAQRPIINQILHPTETLGDYLSVDPTLSAIPFSLSLKLGFSNFLARFPAALFGILSVALLYRLGRILFGNVVGLVAMAILCTSSFHILYSQEGRSYSQFIFFTMASFLFLYLAIIRNKPYYWALYVLHTWAGVSTNHIMLFVIATQGITLTIIFIKQFLEESFGSIKLSTKALGYFSLSLLLIFVLRIPWLHDFTQRQCAGCEIGSPSYPLDLRQGFFVSLQAFTRSNPSFITFAFLILGLIGLLLTLYYFPKQGILLACWLILSILVTIVGLWFISQFYHPRYTIWGLPAFVLIVACGVVSVSSFARKLLPSPKSRLISTYFTRYGHFAIITLLTLPLLIANLNAISENYVLKQGWPIGQLESVANKLVKEANNSETIIVIGMQTRYLQFYSDQARQDLVYIDERNFTERLGSQTLPNQLTGRWYIIHNPTYSSPNMPPKWANFVDYEVYHDIVVIHDPQGCDLKVCINELRTLLSEIVEVNPKSTFTKKLNEIISFLTP